MKKIQNKLIRGTSKISSKYQIVIPKNIRNVVRDVHPGTKVYITLENNSIIVTPRRENWAESVRGIIPKKYRVKDPVAYIKNMRKNLDDRIEKLYKIE